MPDTASEPLLVPVPRASRHGHLTALSMMKDEGPFMLEWIAHHLAVGFTRIVVYTNDCTDGTDDMLIRLEELGLARHRRNRIAAGIKPQPSALNHAQADPAVGESDWLMVLDADEFLCIRHGDGTLDDLLDAVTAADADGLVVTWRIFGSAGIRDWSRDFVTEQYRMAAPPMWNKGWGVKTLFRFDPAIWKLGIHRPKMRNKVLDTDFPHSVKWLNGSGREMEDYFKFRGWRSIQRTIGYDWAQMNHYAVKSIDSYALRRLRGNVNNKAGKYGTDYWALQDRNEVRDEGMLRYSDRRRAIFDGLMADPVLARLHDTATRRAEARLEGLRVRPEYGAFVAELQAAGAVPISRVEARPPKPRDAGAIAARMTDVGRRAAPGRQAGTARPPGARAPSPVDVYMRGPVDLAAGPAVEWHRNQSVLLPADPRLFTPTALIQIAEGKFQRHLARTLPRLLPDRGRYVEIGPGSGFLALHLARTLPLLRIGVVERDPGRRDCIRGIWARNGVQPTDRLDLGHGTFPILGPSPAEHPIDMLALGDPALTLDDVAALLDDLAPIRAAVAGRLWVELFAGADVLSATLAARGYAERLPADPAIAAIFGRAAP